ncbi:MAG: glycosyltransferase family 4 protein [Chitinophagaceae bacterium]|nr:glycosyltransferase family 4 protein [Chitinophagaceae bacterium]
MKRKVACHISYHNAFDDRIYWKELLSLKDEGYETVHLCVSDKDDEYISEEGIKIIEVKRKKIISNLWLNRIVQLLLKRKGTLNDILKKAESVSADVYHYHDLQLNSIVTQLKTLPQHPKVVYDVHELWWQVVKEQRKKGVLYSLNSTIQSLVYKRWELKHAKNCDFIIATDQHTYDYFQRCLADIPKQLIYNYSYFLPQNIVQKNEKEYHFIYTGLLAEARGILEIIKATALLKKVFFGLKILLIGPFENNHSEQRIKALIRNLQLKQNIELHTPVPFKEIQHYYSKSKIGLGLFHFTPKYSTFVPIKLFEYMAFGLPVIFSNHGPSSEIIKQANCGLLVDPLNIPEVYNAMKQLLEDADLYNTLSKNGKAAVVNKYNWENEKQKVLDVYSSLLNS